MHLDKYLHHLNLTFHSNINGEIKVITFLRKKKLFVQGISQSGEEYVWMWKQVLEKLKRTKIHNCLILGIGGGNIVGILQKKYPDISITGVEIDPLIIEVAKKYFDLKTNSFFKIINADAISWLKRQNKINYFDLIVVDLFIGKYNPPSIRKMQFLENIKKLLTEKGTVFYNAHFDTQRGFVSLYNTCQKVFVKVQQVFEYPLNRVLQLEK